jgi:cysteine desulfurase/selenocysteine lyase
MTAQPVDASCGWFTSEELEELRRVTPGTQHVVHLNNAGAALPPEVVTRTMVDHLTEEARIGGYEAASKHRPRFLAVHESIAALIGARSSEIAIVESATVAWQQALGAVPLAAGDTVVCSTAEYHANYLPLLQVAKRSGATLRVIPEDDAGALDVVELERVLRTDATIRLIALTYIPSNGGLVNPAAEVGALARHHGVFFLLDACQGVGQLPIDVAALGCDMLCASARKFLRGPRGVGFLYIRQECLDRLGEPHMVDGHSATWLSPTEYEVAPGAQRFETWEFNVAAVLGMGAAVDYALKVGMDRVWGRVQHLAGILRSDLAAIEGVELRDKGRVQCGIVSFTVEGTASEAVQAALAQRGINIACSFARAALVEMRARGLAHVCRVSVHYYNTEAEIKLFADGVRALAAVQPT